MPGTPVTAAERRVVRRLREAGALRPGAADRLEGLRGLQQRRLAHLVTRGIVRETEPGLYYLDEDAWDAYVSAKRRLAFIMLAIVAAVGLIVFALKGHAQSTAAPAANGGGETARAGVASGTVTELSIEEIA